MLRSNGRPHFSHVSVEVARAVEVAGAVEAAGGGGGGGAGADAYPLFVEALMLMRALGVHIL